MDLICSVKYHAVMTRLKCKGILFMVSNKAPCDVGVNDLISIISRATKCISLLILVIYYCVYIETSLWVLYETVKDTQQQVNPNLLHWDEYGFGCKRLLRCTKVKLPLCRKCNIHFILQGCKNKVILLCTHARKRLLRY